MAHLLERRIVHVIESCESVENIASRTPYGVYTQYYQGIVSCKYTGTAVIRTRLEKISMAVWHIAS